MNEYTIILPDSKILTFQGDRIEAGQFGVRIYVNDKIVGIVPNFAAAWKEQDEGRRCCCPDCRRPNVTISGREFSAVLSQQSAESFAHSRETCRCGHRRKDHPDNGPCRRYDTPDCPCAGFTKQEGEGR